MSASTKTWVNNQAPSCEDADLNGFKLENNNLIEGSGQSLNTADNQQTHKAVSAYGAVGQFMQGGGVADAYTANAPSPRINPEQRETGMVLRFQAAADNTGACTLNAFGTGVDDIKLSDGISDPVVGDIIGGEDVTVIDRGTFFELVRDERIGVGQEWQDVTGSRASDVIYTNSTGRPIMIFISIVTGTADADAVQVRKDGGSPWVGVGSESGTSLTANQVIVPIGHQYRTVGININLWSELRL